MPKINLSLKLVGIFVFAFLFGDLLPEKAQAFFYALSLSLKSLLLFVLPIIIFSCLFSCLLAFRGKRALGFMGILLTVVCASTYLSTLVAYGVGSFKIASLELLRPENSPALKTLIPLWKLSLPTWLPNDYALYLGFGLGSFFAFFPNPLAYRFSIQAKRFSLLFLEKSFIPVLPLFILGFILKMQYEGILRQIIESYLPLIGIILLVYALYLSFLFLLAAHFNFKRCLEYIKNVFPVILMGFSTMSSLATLPVTLIAAEKNTDNADIARAVIPATVNIHMVGGSIGIPLMALAILSGFGQELPSIAVYCEFALYFVLAQFSAAAIPGGTILVMLPVLESHLGFTGEMSALITTLYILFNPAVTISNLLGNSALVIFISKWFKKVLARDPTTQAANEA